MMKCVVIFELFNSQERLPVFQIVATKIRVCFSVRKAPSTYAKATKVAQGVPVS